MTTDDVLTRGGGRVPAHCSQREFAGEREELLAARAARARAVARGRAARLPGGDAVGARGRLAGAAGAGGPGRSSCRDHGADRSQDGDQRAELGRAGLHGGLRGRQLADLGEHGRRAAQPLRGDRADDPPRDAGEGLRAGRATSRRCSCARAAGICVERHFEVDGAPISGSLFDFGLYLLRNHEALRGDRHRARTSICPSSSPISRRGCGTGSSSAPRTLLGIPRGTIRATVLIETILAAFEMDEILYELGPHATGLNAGRWDYLFSVIKKLGHRPEFVLPDRNVVGMGVPFMRAYAELLVATCHRRGAHAIGGMAAFIPSRRDPEVNARRAREGPRGQGARGLAGLRRHLGRPPRPRAGRARGLRPRARRSPQPARRAARGRRARRRARCSTSPRRPGEITEAGLRNDISVGIQYIAAWLRRHRRGRDLQPDGGRRDPEISRAQVWQWLHHGRFTAEHVRAVTDEEMAKLGPGYEQARELFDQVATGEEFVEFLTLPAYELLG